MLSLNNGGYVLLIIPAILTVVHLIRLHTAHDINPQEPLVAHLVRIPFIIAVFVVFIPLLFILDLGWFEGNQTTQVLTSPVAWVLALLCGVLWAASMLVQDLADDLTARVGMHKEPRKFSASYYHSPTVLRGGARTVRSPSSEDGDLSGGDRAHSVRPSTT